MRLRSLVTFGLTLAPLLSQTRTGGAVDRALLLDVVVNDQRIGEVADFRQSDGVLLATRAELTQLGFDAGEGAAADLLPLGALPAVRYRLDEATQTVFLTAPPSSLRPAQLSAGRAASPEPPHQSGTGFVLNYDAAATVTAGRVLTDALLDARAYSPWGVVSASGILRSGGGLGSVRLDTTYTFSDPDTLVRVRAGDVIQSGLAWTRPVRLGGAQLARDFSLRPDLVTLPVPTIAGQVAVPSTVDVLVNGVQQFSANATPGPFEIRALPVVTGANTVQVVVRDALGQQSTQTLPIYTSHALLAAGLDQFSLEAGAIRLGYGVWSDAYAAPLVSGSYRRGVADWLTLEFHGEATSTLAMAGGGASAPVAGLGVVSLAAAMSRGAGKQGWLGVASFERITPRLSLSASWQWTNGTFQDVAARYGQPFPSRQARVGIGVPVPGAGSLSLSFAYQRAATARAHPAPFFVGQDGLAAPFAFAPPLRTSLLALSYSTPILAGRAFAYATSFHDFDQRASTGALVGVTIPLGTRSSATLGGGWQAGGGEASLQATRSVVSVGDAGGQLLAAGGRDRRLLAVGQYRSEMGQLEMGVDEVPGATSFRARATGALVAADGTLFAANTIQDSFAIVDTDGAPGVQVLYENRPIQRTDGSGRALLPDLRSYEPNRVALDPTDLPLDAEIGATEQIVRPPDRSGVVVRFPVRRSRAALLRLVDPQGKPLPVASRVQGDADRPDSVVGYDGEAFVSGLGSHAQLVVVSPSGRPCRVDVDFRPEPGAIPTIGPLTCIPGTAP